MVAMRSLPTIRAWSQSGIRPGSPTTSASGCRGCETSSTVRAQYDAEVAYADLCIAHVLNRLEELGLVENTLLIVGADHGEELDDHGCWFDHHGLYDTNVRVPLIMRLPGRLPAGQVVTPMVSWLDVAPTVLDLAGLPTLSAVAGLHGRSLTTTIRGESPAGTWPAVYLTECTWMRKRGWRTSEWKLIRALEDDIYEKPPVELYHLTIDPLETTNLADARPEDRRPTDY